MDQPLDDAAAVKKVLEGDREAFRGLVDSYSGIVYRIAYSMTGNPDEAQDVVQEVFYRAYRALKSYTPDRPFKAWINRITVNFVLDQRKKKRIKASSLTMEDDQMLHVPDSTYNPHEEQRKSEREDVVLKAIRQLPEKYQTVLLLRHIEDLSYEEIAQTLSLPLGTVMTHIHRARTKLSEILRPMQSELLS
ncbi:MAG: sigma-70 family RNA polymerase sigma factor [Candidatus Omnitrophica bacterium]|nr:sigma-70 family RNA polymerase sigma factor [Candidatus Omnitrophota bacterium]